VTECLGDGGLVVTLKLMGGVVDGLRGHLLPAERPEGWEVRLSEHSLVRLDDLFSCARDKEVSLNLTTKSDIAESAST
jgi:inorganic triphosphatase YgiF